MKYLLCILGMFLGMNISMHAQCNQQLVDLAAQKAGPEAIYIRDFKLKLSEGSMSNPSPTGRFPVFLNEGVNYRFTLADDSEAMGFAILQLVRKDKLLGTTYSFENGTKMGTFDFECKKSATYEVLISFYEGLPGCAAGVLSLVLQDSITVIEPGVATVSDSADVLYLFIENEMNIAATGVPRGHLEVQVSNGNIEQRGKSYFVVPEKKGELVVYVAAYKNNGLLSEKDSLLYFVEYPPLPDLILPGMRGHVLYRKEIRKSNTVELYSYIKGMEGVYKLEEFTIGSKRNLSIDLSSNGTFLSNQQIAYIRSLEAGDKFHFARIRFIDPEGKVHTKPGPEVWVED